MSPRGQLNNQDIHFIITVFLHGMAGMALTLILGVFTHLNYGIYTAPVSMAFMVITVTLQRYLSGDSQKDILIKSLNETIEQLKSQIPQN